ncbi:hypothetical protein RB601_000786 [Gaeumannomyces tritici]
MADTSNASPDTSHDTFSWLQTVSSVGSALIAIVTLITVYIAATQLATQNRLYRLGLSREAVGPWETKVANTTLLGLRRRVYAPSISLSSLAKSEWKPRFGFPRGFPEKAGISDEEAGANFVQAKASWVNFMEGLGISPASHGLYEMQDASELVNRVVPMTWVGKDLVGLCSILGFQSCEKKPSPKSPMPLPIQWSGPLGWLQFRSSPTGCVAEFRRRMVPRNQISDGLHSYWEKDQVPCENHFLLSRLCNSINSFCLSDGRILFLGGISKGKHPQDDEDPASVHAVASEQLLQDLTSENLTDEEIMLHLFGKKKHRPKALQRDPKRDWPSQARQHTDEHEMPGFLQSLLREKANTTENTAHVLQKCPGFLSVVINSELADSRGLSLDQCEEYRRRFVEKEDVDAAQYPHNLGNVYMDEGLFKLMKDSLLLLKPDGFYFSPASMLCADLGEAYAHINEQSIKSDHVFPESYEVPAAYPQGVRPHPAGDQLCSAVSLCNELQRQRKAGRLFCSADDMRLLAKVSYALRYIVSPSGHDGRDLSWAMICCPDLSRDVRDSLASASLGQYLSAKVSCKDGWLDCASLPGMAIPVNGRETTRYRTPLVADGEYTGAQVLAALSDVFITFYWIDTKWITDVAVYDATIPQSVTMC